MTYRPGAARWSAFLLAWALTGALGVVDVSAIRQSVVVVFVALNVGPATLGLVDKFLLLVLGLGWMGGIVYAQHVYSEACGKEAGWRLLLIHFRRVTMVELLILAAALGIQVGSVGVSHLL